MMQSTPTQLRIGGYEVESDLDSDSWADRVSVRAPDGRKLTLSLRKAAAHDGESRASEEPGPMRSCFARVRARGVHQGRPFVALDESDATPLMVAIRGRLAEDSSRPMPRGDRFWHAAELLADVADALAELHAMPLSLDKPTFSGGARAPTMTLDDLAPGAVVVAEDGHARLLPTAVARVQRGKSLSIGQAAERAAAEGTLRYLAPERIRGEPPSQESQLYALGAMLYEVLTDRVAFDGPTPVDVALAHLAETPLAPDVVDSEVPSELSELTMVLLAKEPRDRPRSARSVAKILRGEPDEAGTPERARLATPSLVGRESALRALQDALVDTAAGHARVVLITGSTGEGKTRILDEMARWAQLRGHLVAIASAGPGALGTLVSGLARAIEESFGASGTELAFAGAAAILLEKTREGYDGEPIDELSHDVRFEAIDALFLQAQKLAPLVIAIDDAHRLDESAAHTIGPLATRSDRRMCIALTFGETALPNAVAMLVGRLSARREARRVELAPLHVQDVEAAIASMIGANRVPSALLSWVFSQSKGNPYLVRELLHAAVDRHVLRREPEGWLFSRPEGEELPEGALAMVAGRLSELTEEQRAVAVDVALIGDLADHGLLARCSSLDAQLFQHCIEALVRSRVIEERRGVRTSYVFPHSALRERLLRDLSPEQKSAAHRRIAVAIEEATGGRPNLPALRMVAHHREQAGDHAEAGERWFRFTQRAVRRGDAAMAREGLEGLSRNAQPDSGPRSAPPSSAQRLDIDSERVLWLRSDVLRISGDLRATESLLRSIARTPSRRAEALVRLAKVFEDEGRMRDALEAAESALDALGEPSIPHGVFATLYVLWGYFLMFLLRPPKVAPRKERDLALAAYVIATRSAFVVDRRVGTASYFRARARARALADRDYWIWAQCSTSIAFATAGMSARAIAIGREGLVNWRVIDDPQLRIAAATSLTVAFGILGEEIDKQVFLRDLEAQAASAGDRFSSSLARGYRAYALWQRGRLEEAQRVIEAHLSQSDGLAHKRDSDSPKTESRLLRASLSSEEQPAVISDVRALTRPDSSNLDIPHIGLHENVLGSIAAARGDEKELARLRGRAASIASGTSLYAPHDELLVASGAAKMALYAGDVGSAVLWARRAAESAVGTRSSTALTIESWGVYLTARALDGVRMIDPLDRHVLAEASRAFRRVGAANALLGRGLALWAWATESVNEAARVLEEESRRRPEGFGVYDGAVNDLCIAKLLSTADPSLAAERAARGKKALRRIGAVAPKWLSQFDGAGIDASRTSALSSSSPGSISDAPESDRAGAAL